MTYRFADMERNEKNSRNYEFLAQTKIFISTSQIFMFLSTFSIFLPILLAAISVFTGRHLCATNGQCAESVPRKWTNEIV
jgi:hypothetical protein